MKELSIEQKAIAYDKAIVRAKAMIKNAANQDEAIGFTNTIFPELESEDEKIREEIIAFIKKRDKNGCDYDYDKWLAWLEKQKEFVSADFDDVWVTADCDELTAPLEKYSKDAIKEMCHAWYDKGIELERKSWLEKQEKTADKVKFKVGDWVVTDKNNIVQIKAVNEGYYTIDNGMDFSISYVDGYWHLWTIKDAKDGDVLVTQKTNVTYESIFIFNKIENNRIIQYLHYFTTDADEKVCEARHIDGFLGFVGTTVHPATKEQSDTLMKAMADAGWEFDFEKKELKKIEHWSGKDEANFQCVLSYVNSNPLLEDVNVENCISWLKSIKDRLEQK